MCRVAFRILPRGRVVSPSQPLARMERFGFGRSPKVRTPSPRTCRHTRELSCLWRGARTVRVSPPAAETERFESGGLPRFRPHGHTCQGPAIAFARRLRGWNPNRRGFPARRHFHLGLGKQYRFSDLANRRPLSLPRVAARAKRLGNQLGEIHVWHRSARDPVWSVKPAESEAGDDQTVWRVRWSRDGKKLASSSHTGAVQVWEPDSGTAPRLIGKMPDFAMGLGMEFRWCHSRGGLDSWRDLVLESRGRRGAGLEDSRRGRSRPRQRRFESRLSARRKCSCFMRARRHPAAVGCAIRRRSCPHASGRRLSGRSGAFS